MESGNAHNSTRMDTPLPKIYVLYDFSSALDDVTSPDTDFDSDRIIICSSDVDFDSSGIN